MKLTGPQSRILTFLRVFQAYHGFCPTRQEIADKFGYASTNAAHEHLKAMERRGAIELFPGTARGIRIIDSSPDNGSGNA